jgi:glutaredoxin
MKYTHVEGKNKGKVVLYAISTCVWCKKTKRLLKGLGVQFDYIDVDLLTDEEKEEAKREVLRWRKRAVYPLLVIDDKRCIKFYDEEEIKEALEG